MGDDGAGHLSPLLRRPLFAWDRSEGAYRVNIDPGIRQAVRSLMEEYLGLLEEPDAPMMHRLFPPAYSDPAHAEAQDEYQRLMHGDLVERQQQQAHLVVDTIEWPTLDEEQMLAWSRALNGVRLVLGTVLDITEDDDRLEDPDDPRHAAYQLLTWLLDEAIEALSGRK